MADKLEKEDGGYITLEDGSGDILLEADAAEEDQHTRTGLYAHLSHKRRRPRC